MTTIATVGAITLKQVPIGSRMFCELKKMADARRVPIFETTFIANSLRGDHWREKVPHLFERAWRFGLGRFMICECRTRSASWRARPA